MEGKLAATEALLASREAEFNEMNKKINELKSVAESARKGLGRAQAQVGKLRGAVESQYSELRPRLIQDFQSLAATHCRTSAVTESGFADCVELKVLPSSVLVSLEASDRDRLLRIVRERTASIHKAWTEFSNGIDQRKQDIEAQKKEAQSKCEQLKATDDYKDNFKRIEIDYQCNTDTTHIVGDQLKIQLDEMFSDEKILSPALSSIARDFLATKP